MADTLKTNPLGEWVIADKSATSFDDGVDLTRNILKTYGLATRKEKLDGLRWYKKAKRECRALALAKGVTLRHSVGVVAATSPNLNWNKNVHTAGQVIDGYQQGLDHEAIEGCMAYKSNRLKGYKVMRDPNLSKSILKTLNGPKISAFFDNIMGGDSVTVDGHARNIAYGERVQLKSDKANIGVAEYKTLAQAYRDAASILNIKACDLQAITWVAWRRMHGIK